MDAYLTVTVSDLRDNQGGAAPLNCAVARAAQRRFKDPGVRCGLEQVVTRRGTWHTSWELQRLIMAIDGGAPLEDLIPMAGRYRLTSAP